MTLQQLRYVIGIAKVGSFNKAAENLFISQPSLTTAIRDLEEEIGIVIFNRTSRGVSLTPDGEEFVASCITITRLSVAVTTRPCSRRRSSPFRRSIIPSRSSPSWRW